MECNSNVVFGDTELHPLTVKLHYLLRNVIQTRGLVSRNYINLLYCFSCLTTLVGPYSFLYISESGFPLKICLGWVGFIITLMMRLAFSNCCAEYGVEESLDAVIGTSYRSTTSPDQGR
jgi:hypothetical protein